MTRIRMTISYDGTDFCGWQSQGEDRESRKGEKPSVGLTLQTALATVFKQPISLFASGRTDAGVHALNQVCHFDVDMPKEKLKGWNLSRALKSHLPDSIVIKKAWLAPDDFHSTLSPDKKTYRYLVLNSEIPSAILNRNTYLMRQKLDLNYLNECSKYLIGEHDFKSFQSVGSTVSHTVRTIYSAEWSWLRPRIAQFTITGSGFLKQMVRNIVGTQLLLHRKGNSPSDIQGILIGKDRKLAGPPAEPQGLYLVRVYYPQDLDNRCAEL